MITFYCSVSFGQNTLTSTGNVGVGTANPTTQLEVVGNTKLGRVAIMDSVTVEKNMRIKDSLCVQKKLLVGQDVRIIGNTKMKGNAFVEGIFKFKGLADTTTTENRFLMIRPNGKVETC